MKFLIINGPNLNMLGIREPDIYGSSTLASLEEKVRIYCDSKGIESEFFQSNHEGELVEAIQKAYFDHIDGIIINPAAYTHTSVAILDAVKAVMIPTVEVHLSDVPSREAFRQISYISYAAVKTITGKHFDGYLEAVDVLQELLLQNKSAK